VKEKARHLLEGGTHVSIGVLTADLLRLGEELALLEEAGAELVHVDVMDGVFCPQMTVGPPFVRALAGPFLKDVHLMIEQPETKVDAYVAAGADVIAFNLEGTRHPHRVVQALAGTDVVAGVALNPGTPLQTVEPLLDLLDYVLLLAVNPGWPGQRFAESTARRIGELRKLIGGREVLVGVDGGITRENVGGVAAMGADLIVTGSAVFDGKAPLENARFMIEEARLSSPAAAGRVSR
jgi:ribulose-phosphate 3-epimerase